ncbi:MAG: helix-turn-helix domain-containing protein [Gammaproteobacteria bacterium]|nr:helix-turn-helix domain-containing protein [Gammaproteobacteria bacterium]
MKSKLFSERLNLCLDKLGLPPKNYGRIQQLAAMVGLSHRGAGKWLSGQSSPPAGKFALLAKQLQVDEHWLRTGEGQMCCNEDAIIERGVLGITLAVPLYLLPHIPQTHKQPYDTLTCILPYAGDFYGIVLKTEAMSPRFPAGSIIIFDAQATARDGDFILAQDPMHSEPIFRQLLKREEVTYLHAHNPNFERLAVHAEPEILGKLVQSIVSFE